MSVSWISEIAASKNVALILSLCFNAVLCTAIWRIWKSRESLQDKVISLLTELISEMNRRYWNEKK